MTGILSREQEFHKINEQLNNMTKYALEKPQPVKIESKFATYTKKGPSTVLRQSGLPKPLDDISLGSLTDPRENPSLNGARKKVLPKERPLQAISENKKPGVERPVSSSPRHSVRTLPATSKNSLLKKMSNNVVMRYKNSSFIPSPSLEVLVRGGAESVRSNATSCATEASGGQSTIRTKANLSSEGLIKYLKSRIAILQQEHETLTHEMENQKELVEKSVERQKKVETQRDSAYARNNHLTDQMSKLENQLEEALRRLKESDDDHNETRKQLEATRRELKVLHQSTNNLEKRLYRTTEELENTRNALSQIKNSEKEIKDAVRNEAETRDKQIKALRKQRADLLNAYKKQLFLIDNLKRQNLCMEQSRMIAFGEKEFTKVLDWHSKT